MSIAETDPVKTCYPEPVEIPVVDDIYIIRPLKVREFPTVSSSFMKIMNKAAQGKRDVPEMLESLYDELMELLDFVTERPEGSKPVGDLPMRYMPAFVNAFLEHNVVGEDVLGNWRNLIQNLGSLLDQVLPGLFKDFRKALDGSSST